MLHNVRYVRYTHPNVATGGSGAHRFRLDESELEVIQKQLAQLPNSSRSGEGRARDHLRAGRAGHPVGRSVLAFVIRRALLFLGLAIALADFSPVFAREHRSREVTREFQREHPCPSTGQTAGCCPGYRKDHIVIVVSDWLNMACAPVPQTRHQDQVGIVTEAKLLTPARPEPFSAIFKLTREPLPKVSNRHRATSGWLTYGEFGA